MELLVLIALLALGVIGAVRQLSRSTSDLGGRVAEAVRALVPLEGTASGAVPGEASLDGADSQQPRGSNDPASQTSPPRDLSLIEKIKLGLWVYREHNPRTSGIRSGVAWVNERIEDAKKSGMELNRQVDERLGDVPIIGPVAKATTWITNRQAGVSAGAAQEVVGIVGGALKTGIDPVGGAMDGIEMLAHVPTVGPNGLPLPNGLKVAGGLVDVVDGKATLGDVLSRTANPLESAKDDAKFWSRPYEQDWNEGDYAELTGRAGVNLAMLLLPLKGARGKSPPMRPPPPPGVELPPPGVKLPPKVPAEPPPKVPAPSTVLPPERAPRAPGELAPPKAPPPPRGAPLLDTTGNVVQQVSPKGKVTFELSETIANREKIVGQPEAGAKLSPEPTAAQLETLEKAERAARREAAGAEYLAGKDHVTKVYTGAEADRYINGPAGKKSSVDNVAVTEQGKILLSESKGKHVGEAVKQLEESAERLGLDRIEEVTVVAVEGLEPGYTVQNGKLFLHGEKVQVAGKDVGVFFAP